MKKNQLFTMVTTWIQNKQVIVLYYVIVIIPLWQVMQQRLGVQLVGIFCEAEGPDFSKRVSTVLPLLSECLNVDDHVSFVVVIKDDDMI